MLFKMATILLFLLLVNYKIQCQILFEGRFSPIIPGPEIQEEFLSENTILKGENGIRNPDFTGTLPQQVLIRTFSRFTSSDCTGTMLTDSIAITAAHCVTDRGSNNDVLVYHPEQNCGRLTSGNGIEACKVVQRLEGDICQYNGHDIALVKLSKPMAGMKTLRLNFDSIQTGQNTIMAGTGVNFNRTCESQISYQTVEDCSRVSCYGSQWYCTSGSYKEPSGACTGDSGGPSWTFRSGLTGLTAAATVDTENDPCTNGYSLFTNLKYYKSWVEETMRNMETCSPIDVDHHNITNNPNPFPIINGVLGFFGDALGLIQRN